MNEEVKKTYEISFLSKSENGAAVLVSHIKSAGGEIIHEGNIKEMKLAYPIKKETSAYFGCINATLPGEAIDDMTKALNLEGDILRFLIITPPLRGEQKEQTTRQIRRPQTVTRESSVARASAPAKKAKEDTSISNELLEEKLEEILK